MYNGWFFGAAIGALGSIIAVDLWGRKTTMLVNCVIAVFGAIIMTIATQAGYQVMHPNIKSVFLAIAAGRFIMGISTGALGTTIPIYIAEASAELNALCKVDAALFVRLKK